MQERREQTIKGVSKTCVPLLHWRAETARTCPHWPLARQNLMNDREGRPPFHLTHRHVAPSWEAQTINTPPIEASRCAGFWILVRRTPTPRDATRNQTLRRPLLRMRGRAACTGTNSQT